MSSVPTDDDGDPGPIELEYNWHPAVHSHRFEERLYFFLIRLRDPAHRPVANQVREVLELAGVQYACEYSIFGYWDALVRSWLTLGSYRRLIRVFQREDVNVADFRYFEATRIRFLWTGSTADLLADDKDVLSAMAERDADIVATVSSPATARAKWASLASSGLAFKRHQADGESVKFYVTLKRTGGDLPLDAEENAVLSGIGLSGMRPSASLYIGVGPLAEYLVRCVAPTYRDVLRLVASLDESLAGTSLRPTTLLIANTNARESDNVNDPQPLSERDQSSLMLLSDARDSTLEATIARLTTDERTALNELVNRAFRLSEGDLALRSKLVQMLRASVLNDHTALSSALSFLLDFEWLLGEYLKPTWASVFGSNWIETIGDELKIRSEPEMERSAEELKRPLNMWTLGSLVYLAIATARISDVFTGRLDHQLGEHWEEQMRLLIPLRNSFAHGRLRRIARLDVLTGESFQLLKEMMDVASLSARVEKIVLSQESAI